MNKCEKPKEILLHNMTGSRSTYLKNESWWEYMCVACIHEIEFTILELVPECCWLVSPWWRTLVNPCDVLQIREWEPEHASIHWRICRRSHSPRQHANTWFTIKRCSHQFLENNTIYMWTREMSKCEHFTAISHITTHRTCALPMLCLWAYRALE